MGIPMQVVGIDARLLRDEAGANLYYKTNSVTIGGGQTVDAILDTTGLPAGGRYFLYNANLHHLANTVARSRRDVSGAVLRSSFDACGDPRRNRQQL